MSFKVMADCRQAEIDRLKRERDDYLREAHDPRAWGHHRAYANNRAIHLHQQITELEKQDTGGIQGGGS